ncbi:MAG: NADPH-dependent 7-cyano-7-deazaguanine reductase QueF [Gammaproteobacteria bacterium]|nr:NADPH-dependent 7-cyano-7-deazaguanine reductase QueF [Gammaproteobacteria bacterium]
MNDDLPLGRRVAYLGSYDPSVLRTIERRTARERIGIGDPLPFLGEDVWNCYELSWLEPSGLPRVGVLTLRFPVDSLRIVESKSVKLYLGGFSGSKFEDSAAVGSTIKDDLSRKTGSAVEVTVGNLDDVRRLGDFTTFCLDHLPISVHSHERSPELPAATGNIGRDAVHTHLFRSVCPVTGQPDWGSIAIAYRGRLLDRTSVLRYLVSYREAADFHESVTERIFIDLNRTTDATELTVDARFLRRGGIDINPYRSTALSRAPVVRLPRQ